MFGDTLTERDQLVTFRSVMVARAAAPNLLVRVPVESSTRSALLPNCG